MKKNKLFSVLLIVLLGISSFSSAKIWFVSEGGHGLGDGTSWTNAASDIMDLIPAFDVIEVFDTTTLTTITLFRLDTALIQSNYCQLHDTIFVSSGIYSPLFIWNGKGCNNSYFFQNNDTTLYGNIYQNEICIFGGFEGTENNLSERVLGAHPSIIDGRRQNNCVWIEGKSNVILDGFTLTNGEGEGSAIRAVDCSSLFSNLIITQNNSDSCTLYFENVGKNRGNHNVDFTIDTILPFQLTNTLIYQNNEIDGLLIKAENSEINFLNNTIANNVSPTEGGQFIQLNNNSLLHFKNSILWNNYENRIQRNDNSSKITLFHSGINETPHYPLSIVMDNGHNFAGDPIFISSSNYHVSVKSYAVNNGDYAEFMRFAPTIPEVLLFYDIDNHSRTHDDRFIDIGACQSSCHYFSCYPGKPIAPNYNTLFPLHSLPNDESGNNDPTNQSDVFVYVYTTSGLLVTGMPITEIKDMTNFGNGLYLVKHIKNDTVINSSKIVVINGQIYQ